ncbi:hypothetical protein C7447_101175 [Tenacibaculum adriaticum]|uniref:Uncharacterized protein n=1 Tax=Tenacibaculum adriaticum TaxID=413713 RepID=A0A5S5DUR7_9FLAO|nr:hypothetical protein [Tenacibaculum adriaticum]TYP99575.1 hypothetical protein C7447_101175 [Tenacibaculum adriaticum]
MLKKISVVLAFTLSSLTLAQEKIVEFENFLKTNGTFIKDVFPIINHKNHDISIFIADAKKVYGYKLNNNFKLIGNLSSEKKEESIKR